MGSAIAPNKCLLDPLSIQKCSLQGIQDASRIIYSQNTVHRLFDLAILTQFSVTQNPSGRVTRHFSKILIRLSGRALLLHSLC